MFRKQVRREEIQRETKKEESEKRRVMELRQDRVSGRKGSSPGLP